MTTTEKPRAWARHFQDSWLERSGDDRLPYWLRLVSLAYGRHTANGHAKFKRGEIGLILATVDDDGVPQPYDNVGRAIDAAVKLGWLEEGSFWGCLIVPACSIRKGDLNGARTVCPLTPRHARRKKAA